MKKFTEMKRLTYTALTVAVALILSYVEYLVPLTAAVPIPGFKAGLSNMAVLFAVLYLGRKEGFLVFLLKVFLSALLFGAVASLPFSLCGGLLAFCAMAMLKGQVGKTVSVVGVSLLAAALHNVGQILAAVAVMGSRAVFYYLPILLFVSLFMGVLTGLACTFSFKKMQDNKLLGCEYEL